MESRDVFFAIALCTFNGCLAVSHKVNCRGTAPIENAMLLAKGFVVFKGLISEVLALLERMRLVVDQTLPVGILNFPACAVCLRVCGCVRYYRFVQIDVCA